MDSGDTTFSRRAFLTSVGASLAVAIFPAACGGAPAATTAARKRIAFGFPFRVVDIYRPLIAAVRDEAAKRNYQIIESSAGISAAAQLAEVNTWIAQGVEGIVLFALDPNSMGPVVNRAHAAGLKVIGYAEHLPGEDGSVVFNNRQGANLIGTIAGKWIVSHLGGNAKVGVLANVVGGPEDIIRVQNAISAMQSAAPGAVVVATVQANDAATALTVSRPMLQAHPDIDVVVAITDDDINGLESALKEAGKQPSSVWWASYDASTPILKKMLTGEVRGVDAELPVTAVGQAVVSTAANAIEHKSPTSFAPDYTPITDDDKSEIQKLLAERGAA